MASSRREMTLQQAGVVLIDCDHRTPAAADDGFPYIAIPQLKGGRLDLSDVRTISEADFVEWTRKAKPQSNDVILSRRCNPGETAYVPAGLECALGQNLVLLRAARETIYPPFLRWLVRGPGWWDQVRTFLNVGAVFDSLKCADIPNFTLPVPPVDEQKAIAHILGTLDDKIELNRRMNATLEAMARALFQSWFVDFDPVRAKVDGRNPAGMDATTAALFPDSFEGSALGDIPAGWTVGELADVSTNPRRSVAPSEIPPNTPYIGLEHMPRHCVALGDWSDASEIASGKSAFRTGEILFGKLRPYFHKVGVAPVNGVCSTDILVLAPKSSAWFGFLLGHVSSDALIQFSDLASTGTKMPRTNWSDIGSFKVVLPPDRLAARLTSQIEPMVQRINAGLHQSRTLAALRDTLLPKLLSGELSLCQAEKTVSAMA